MGISYGVDALRGQSALRGHQWLVDNIQLRYRGTVGDLELGFDNALALSSPTTSPTYGYTNSANFLSTKAQFRFGGPTTAGAASHTSQMIFSNIGAFLRYRFTDKWSVVLGHLRVPFGLEGMHDRLDIPTYYYSNSYAAAQVFGWHYDYGVLWVGEEFFLGKLEVGFIDGRHPKAYHTDGTEVSSPAFVFRLSKPYQSGDWQFLSAASAYLGRFRGRPGDIGFTLGSYMKNGRLRINVEYLFASTMTSYTSDLSTAQAFPGTEYVGETTTMPGSLNILGNAKPGHRAQAWSIYLEPGWKFGESFEVTAKLEYGNHEYEFAKEDINIAAGVTHTINDSAKLRWVYQHFNLLGNLSTHAHDTRLLVSLKF